MRLMVPLDLKISPQGLTDPRRVGLEASSFAIGGLPLPSCVVLADTAKVNRAVVTRYVGRLQNELLSRILKARILAALS